MSCIEAIPQPLSHRAAIPQPAAGDYRVIVTGSRDWAEFGTILYVFKQIRERCPPGRLIILVNGRADPFNVLTGRKVPWEEAAGLPWRDQFGLLGADWLTYVAAQQFGWIPELHPVYPGDWERHGRKAGHIRNAAMVARGASEAHAFLNPCADRGRCLSSLGITHPSHGSEGCARRAHDAGIPTTWWAAPQLSEWFGLDRNRKFSQGRVVAA